MNNDNGPWPQPQNQVPPAAPPPMQPPPQQPQNQMPPQPPTQPPVNYSLPPKKSSTGLIVGIIFGALALVGVVVAVFVFIFMFSGSGAPSKADYRETLKDSNAFIEEYNKLTFKNPLKERTALSESEYRSRAKELSQAMDSLRDKFNKLENAKAISKDEDLKAVHKKAKEQLSNFFNTMELLIELNDKIMPEISKIADLSKASYAGDRMAVIKEASSAFGKLATELKVSANKEYAKKIADCYGELIEIVEGGGTGYSDESKVQGILEGIESATETINNSVDDSLVKANSEKELNALSEALEKKANK